MKIRKIIRERPTDIPKDWWIMNAPRPLWGNKQWTGEFLCGVYYVALDLDGELYQDRVEYNKSMDATILEFISRQEVVDEMLAYYQDRPKAWEKLKGYDFSDSNVQDQLIETWYNLEMNWSDDANEETK